MNEQGQLSQVMQMLQTLTDMVGKLDDKVGKLETEFKGEIGELGDKVGKLDNKVGKLETELKGEIGELNRYVGNLLVDQLRPKVARKHGDDFATSLTYRTLEDLARVIHSADGSRPSAAKVLDGARALAVALLKDGVAEEYTKALEHAMQTSSCSVADAGLTGLRNALNGPWFDGDRLLQDNVKAFLSALSQNQHQPLRLQLGWLLSLLCSPRDQAENKLMQRQANGGSLGIVLLQYAAAPDKYLPREPASYKDLKLASDTVECDVRDSIELYETTALLSVGEITSSSEGYGKGVDQLERRLDFLEWSIRHLQPSATDFVRVGHLYMPKSEAGTAQGSRDDGKTCIHVHYL